MFSLKKAVGPCSSRKIRSKTTMRPRSAVMSARSCIHGKTHDHVFEHREEHALKTVKVTAKPPIIPQNSCSQHAFAACGNNPILRSFMSSFPMPDEILISAQAPPSPTWKPQFQPTSSMQGFTPTSAVRPKKMACRMDCTKLAAAHALG